MSISNNIKMSSRDRQILELFASQVKRISPEVTVWAFGSRARGTAWPDSDLDVCIVTNKLDEAKDKAIMEIAWEVGFAHDVIISTVTYSKEEFEQGPCSESLLVKNVLSEGVLV